MSNKYQKPMARELGEIASATGSCVSGLVVSERCQSGNVNVGPCNVGLTAGQACTNGSTADRPTVCGAGGVPTNCTSGGWAGAL